MKPIGILGGTFDPVHFGHLRPAVDLHAALALAEVRFIPCRTPPHREMPQAAPEHRLAMLRLALKGASGMVIDERELRRDGPSFMIDTLASLRDDLPGTPLCLILGADAFAGFDRWRRWQAIPGLAHLVVTQRPGYALSSADGADIGRLSEQLKSLVRARATQDAGCLSESLAGCVLFQPVTPFDLSATRIRRLAAEGDDLHYLLPEQVRTYIEQHRLYQEV